MARKSEPRREPTVNVRVKVSTWKKIRIMAAKRGIRGSQMIDLLVEGS